ncbi:hypothetical protein GT347_23660 [Xylophilus rhododendri]|uniref:Uncharacterized protein n=1 Tax=Xylophilus rhododendri TaxID=2697032 RepID=A0A857J9P3_9BURK|nr:hypothetical protein [Xylophilus rhododendri]QHJ00715.1 hypothetical protein GT347_23660 [Xylophilus rhododendri]
MFPSSHQSSAASGQTQAQDTQSTASAATTTTPTTTTDRSADPGGTSSALAPLPRQDTAGPADSHASQLSRSLFTQPGPTAPSTAEIEELDRLIDRALAAKWLQEGLSKCEALDCPPDRNPSPGELARSLASSHDTLVLFLAMSREMELALMPRFVETLLRLGMIDGRHAAAAREAAVRVAQYAGLRGPGYGGGSGRSGTTWRRHYMIMPTLRLAIDPPALERALTDPGQWPAMLAISGTQGVLNDGAIAMLGRLLQDLCSDMAASGFLPAGLCTRLHEQVPAILQAARQFDRRPGT